MHQSLTKELNGFEKVLLNEGESTSILLKYSVSDETGMWTMEAGETTEYSVRSMSSLEEREAPLPRA